MSEMNVIGTSETGQPGWWQSPEDEYLSGSKCNFVGAVDLKQGQLVTAVNHQRDQRIYV